MAHMINRVTVQMKLIEKNQEKSHERKKKPPYYLNYLKE